MRRYVPWYSNNHENYKLQHNILLYKTWYFCFYISGIYHGKAVHDSDISDVLTRASSAGVTDIMITASTAEETEEAVQIINDAKTSEIKTLPRLYTTIGVHPTQVSY